MHVNIIEEKHNSEACRFWLWGWGILMSKRKKILHLGIAKDRHLHACVVSF